ncbi:hypothetical protein QM565_01415 [Geitlerinema splendidum]|nr:hypothetical protein [Geitlerinema splendidum]
MDISKQLKVISYLFLMIIFLQTEGKSAWSDEVDIFVAGKLRPLHDSRSHLKRPDFPFVQSIEILDFIEGGKKKHGKATVASSSHTAELIIDVCDIVNLQHPNFKTRYDIFIEQWEGHTQLPFSLFSFDRIAQVFHYRSALFDETNGSAYRQMIEKILENELPVLRGAFGLILNLNAVHYGQPFQDPGIMGYEDYLKDINVSLDQAILTSGKAKAAAQKTIRTKAPNARMRGLCSLSSMAHDYLTLGRIEDAIKVVLNIPAFTHTEQREAFLAGMIQIGELTTNKNLSYFVRHYMPTIPWEDLVHCRDAIEHQDEHGFNTYFESIVNGSNTSINFKDWQEELKTLAQRVSDAKHPIWGNVPPAVFEMWLQKELEGNPIYGVVVEKPQSPSLDQFDRSVKKVFRQTPLFKGSAELWGRLTSGSTQVTYGYLQTLNNEISRLKTLIPNLLSSPNKVQTQKFLDAYISVEVYLWDRIRREIIHLSESEKNTLVDVSKNYFNIPHIANFCIALLNMEQSYLTKENGNLFIHAAALAGLDYKPLLSIFARFRQEMMVTRQVCRGLPFDNSKDLGQSARKELAKRMFVRTTHHLHELAHGPNFEARMRQEMMTIPMRFAFDKVSSRDPKIKALEQKIGELHETHAVMDEYGYANLTPEGQRLAEKEIIGSGLRLDLPEITPEFLQFGEEVMNRFYRSAHKVHLPVAIKRDPTTYLASVYSLSVGIGALKGWVLREPVPPATETAAVEKLRDGRNFIAHGDILRSMNSIDLADIQENLLTDHLEHCAKLNFTQ